MNKQILYFDQHPNHKDTYELFISASGPIGDLVKVRTELEKKLFKTEMKDGSLLVKFEGKYLVVSNMVKYLERKGQEFCH